MRPRSHNNGTMVESPEPRRANPAESAHACVWDPSILSDYVGNDHQVRDQLLSKFLMRSAELVLQMEQALQCADYQALASHSHRLKSAALTVGTLALAAEAQSLETIARAQQLNVTTTLFESLKLSHQLAQQAISQALSQTLPLYHGVITH